MIPLPRIQVLNSHVADLIAAGEVVERPASVVKELMENAIDAGARALSVEIEHGGMSLARVTDDGCGMEPADAETAFLRHATSKIRTECDLEAIATLGFRGEALAAISAVSRVSLTTRTAENDLGVTLTIEGGVPAGMEEAGCPQGSVMTVRDLFFNTPARLKYMKKDSAEGAAVFAVVQRQALAHPEVSVKFIRDGKQELLTPGDGTLKSAVYSVLGRDMALGFTPVSGSGEDGVSVQGFASLPVCCKGSRNHQFFFVNGRFVKSRLLMAALEEAYSNQRMVGKFPGCVLHVTIRPSGVDVNVHPAKTEVKFVSDKRIFDAVYQAVRGTLDQGGVRPVAAPSTQPRPHDTVTPNQTAFRSMTAEEYRTAPPRSEPVPLVQTRPAPPPAPHVSKEPQRIGGGYSAKPCQDHGTLSLHSPVRPGEPVTIPAGVARTLLGQTPLAEPVKAERVPPPSADAPPEVGRAQLVSPTPEPERAEPETIPWQVKGELFHTYILVEQGERAYYIDKHAAHERMNFDRLKAAGYTPMVQRLLAPVVFTPPAEEGAALLQNQELLERFGFEAEEFGGGSVIVRQSPDYVDAGEIEAVLTELAVQLLSAGQVDPAGVRDGLFATMACKAAIKGGQKNGTEELLRVAEAVMTGAVRYCPHGRPVAVELTRGQLEKLFKRA